MTVSDSESSRTTEIMTKAFKEIGVKRRDINGRSQYGQCKRVIAYPPHHNIPLIFHQQILKSEISVKDLDFAICGVKPLSLSLPYAVTLHHQLCIPPKWIHGWLYQLGYFVV